MKVASLRDIVGYDIIIPNWWIEESGLTLRRQKGVYKVSDPEAAEPPQQPTSEPIRIGKTVGRKLTGQQVLTSESFTIEWDKSILIKNDESIQYGFVYHFFEALKMTLDEQWHETSLIDFTVASDLEHRGTLPTKYHQFSELFNPKTFAKLPKHRSYDHAINLMPGEQSP